MVREVVGVIRLVIWLHKFGRETRGFVSAANDAADHEDAARAAGLRRAYRRIVRIVVATLAFGCVVLPLAVPWAGVLWYGNQVEGVASRAFRGFLLSMLVSLLYLFAGVALGCLLAPADFLRSPAGATWMKLIGTKSVRGARVVCGVVAAVGLGVMGGVAALIISMAGR